MYVCIKRRLSVLNKKRQIFAGILVLGMLPFFQGCGAYSFSGISIGPETQTYQVNFFQNEASLVIPGLDRTFTLQLQDLILNQTNLDLVNSGGDIIYEGEITQYYVAPSTATSDNQAAENQLTISVNLRFIDTKDDENDLEQSFSFFFNFPAATSVRNVEAQAHQEIFDRITQDIFNATLARW